MGGHQPWAGSLRALCVNSSIELFEAPAARHSAALRSSSCARLTTKACRCPAGSLQTFACLRRDEATSLPAQLRRFGFCWPSSGWPHARSAEGGPPWCCVPEPSPPPPGCLVPQRPGLRRTTTRGGGAVVVRPGWLAHAEMPATPHCRPHAACWNLSMTTVPGGHVAVHCGRPPL